MNLKFQVKFLTLQFRLLLHIFWAYKFLETIFSKHIQMFGPPNFTIVTEMDLIFEVKVLFLFLYLFLFQLKNGFEIISNLLQCLLKSTRSRSRSLLKQTTLRNYLEVLTSQFDKSKKEQICSTFLGRQTTVAYFEKRRIHRHFYICTFVTKSSFFKCHISI